MRSLVRHADEPDTGFTLIEVIVAMFVLMIFALALIPAFITGFRATSANTTLATASQLVNQQIDDARSRTATCAALQAYQAETIAPVVDGRAVSLQPKRAAITCPGAYPGVVTVKVTVRQTGKTTVLASATTYVLVSSAS